MYPVNEAVERLNGDGDIPRSVLFAKKDSGNAVDPRITPGVCCRKDGDIWQAAKVDQALRIAARWTKRWILVGDGPCSTDIVAECRKFAVKFCNTITVYRLAFRDVSKSGINAFKFYRAEVDYSLSEGINAVGSQQGGKIETICKSETVFLLEIIEGEGIYRKCNTETRIFTRLKKAEMLIPCPCFIKIFHNSPAAKEFQTRK